MNVNLSQYEEPEQKQMNISSTICTEQKSMIAYAPLQKQPYEPEEKYSK